jgi:hypothetical protein
VTTPGLPTATAQQVAQEAAAAWSPIGTVLTPPTCAFGACVARLNVDHTFCGVWCYDGSLAGKGSLSSGTACTCPNLAPPISFDWH